MKRWNAFNVIPVSPKEAPFPVDGGHACRWRETCSAELCTTMGGERRTPMLKEAPHGTMKEMDLLRTSRRFC